MEISRRKVLLSCAGAVAVLLVWNVSRQAGGPLPGDSGTGTIRPNPPAPVPNPTLRFASLEPGAAPAVPMPLQLASAWGKEPDPAVAAFAAWVQRFLAATPVEQQGMMAEGMALAAARRATLEGWIQHDPARALAAAVPEMTRRRLPASLLALLEERVSGVGELSLMAVTPASTGPVPAQASYRKALIGGREFFAYTYGRREALNTLPRASLHGIALGSSLAVSDSPVRVLEAGETPAERPAVSIHPITGATAAVPADQPLNLDPAAPTAIEYNGRIEVMASTEEVLQREVLAAHQEVSEDGAYDPEVVAGNNLPGTSGVAHRPSQAWTHGTKKILLIRIDFSDIPGVPLNISQGSVPITETYAVDRINGTNGVKDFFDQNSFGKTSLSIANVVAGDSPDVTDVLRVPQTASYYATGNYTALLHSDARAAATAAGFAVDSYDRIGVVFSNLGSLPGTQITWGGLAVVQGKNFWVNGNYTFNVVAHEIGHNYGLPHANLWQVSDGNPISPTGVSQDYGDIYDVMGGGYGMENHFSHWNKSLLQWIPDAGVTTITTSGTYRVHRFDHAGANLANTLALKIVRNRDQDYWIGLRRATDNASLDGGAYVLWGYNDSREANLLDLTSPVNDLASAALAVGATFTDSAAGVSLHPVAQGGTGADEWLDVQVTLLPRLSWAQSEFIVDEQGGTATLTLNRDSNSSGSVSVSYATSNGTATAPGDYTTTSGTVTWANGDMAPKSITIPVTADALVEGTESFAVTLSSATGGAVIVNNAAATVTIADPGARDTTFTPAFVNSAVEKFIPLPDGGALMSGWFDGGIVRLKADGSLDSTFLQDGGFGAFTGTLRVQDMARQPDGKIIVGGEFTSFNGQARNRIARLNADGSLDSTFNVGTGANDTVNTLLLQPDGKIVVGGTFTTFNGASARMLTRLNANGSLDATFTSPTFGPGGGWRVECLALQPDGKILAGGTLYFNTGTYSFGICRVASNGTLDSTFNAGFGAQGGGGDLDYRAVADIAVEMDGHILVAGNFNTFNNTARGGIARLTSTGAVDSSLVTTTDGACNALLLQPDGRILLGGSFTTFNGTSASRLVRLSSAGVVESGFVAAGGTNKAISALALQADGKVLLGGQVSMTFQGSSSTSSFWRFFGGLPGLPGTVQFSSETVAGIEGTSATLSVIRTGGSSGVISAGYATVAGTAGSADFTATSGTLTWADGDTAAKTLSIPIISDGTAEGAESFVVNLGQPLRNSTLLSAVQQATVNVATAFDSWRNSNFNPLELADANVSGDLADPDGDGLSNLLEFGLGLPPRSGASSTPPVNTVQNIGGSNYLTLTFKRRTPALDLTYNVQTNNGTLNTVDWLSNAVQVGSAVSNGDGTETVTFRDTTAVTTGQRRFMRVQVTRAP